MLQITQNLRDGNLKVREVLPPIVKAGHLLIANAFSVISAGTERSVIDASKGSLLSKALKRPDQVRRVLQKMRQEGVLSTLSQVFGKLEEPIALGYSSSGVVLASGRGVQGFPPGTRVMSNGPHAEIVCVPRNLCAALPPEVPLEKAAYTVLGAIALNGVRLSKLGIGDTAFVIGLGLIGQITVALLKASGCRVIGTDLDPWKCEMAIRMGADVAEVEISASMVTSHTRGLGADAVLVTASTPSDGPLNLASEAVRPKGRIVIVGSVGMNLQRRPLYFREAELVVSCSYGPGRYDSEYEERGNDYPAGHVRWTENRNFQAILQLMATGRLDVSPITTHRFPVQNASDAYSLIDAKQNKFLGILLEYPASTDNLARTQTVGLSRAGSPLSIGVLGAGGFARTVVLPSLKKQFGVRLRSICSATGLSANRASEKFGFEVETTSEDSIFLDPEINVVFCLTRHDLHAEHVRKALANGKHVYVEKPLALTLEDVESIGAMMREGGPLLMVGFNRRFAPAVATIRKLFSGVSQPITVSVRMNVGSVPETHWTQNEETGGGRLLGEACHAIDLATFLIGSPPVRVYAEAVSGHSSPIVCDDQCFITLRHANGSVSSVAYLAGGDRAYPKERIEVLGGGRLAVVEDFREVTTAVDGKLKTDRRWRQDKGHGNELRAFADAIAHGGPPPIPWEDIRAVSLASILADRSLKEGVPLEIPLSALGE